MKIAMIGSGGWGTAMVTSLAARHDDLELYCRREEAARELKETRENKEYLPGVRIPVHVKITSDLEKAVSLSLIHISCHVGQRCICSCFRHMV